MTLGGWAFEKGKRGPNESKVTLFTIGTAFLASGLNVTINERNLMFEKKIIKKSESGGPFKRVRTCPNGPKVIFLLIKNLLFGIFVLGAVPRSSALCLFS